MNCPKYFYPEKFISPQEGKMNQYKIKDIYILNYTNTLIINSLDKNTRKSRKEKILSPIFFFNYVFKFMYTLIENYWYWKVLLTILQYEDIVQC